MRGAPCSECSSWITSGTNKSVHIICSHCFVFWCHWKEPKHSRYVQYIIICYISFIYLIPYFASNHRRQFINNNVFVIYWTFYKRLIFLHFCHWSEICFVPIQFSIWNQICFEEYCAGSWVPICPVRISGVPDLIKRNKVF